MKLLGLDKNKEKEKSTFLIASERSMRMNPYHIPDNISNGNVTVSSNSNPAFRQNNSNEFEESNLSYAQKVQLMMKEKEEQEAKQ